MLKTGHATISGFEAAIRGCRYSWNSQDKSDSKYKFAKDEHGFVTTNYVLGENDLALLSKLVKAGDEHAKALRMVTVWVDVTAPRYWWTEFDTYHFVTRCSESTMHTITNRAFTGSDFSYDGGMLLSDILYNLNNLRTCYKAVENDKELRTPLWRQIIQILPQSYNQTSVICTNYQELRHMYKQRKNHKLTEWHDFCDWIESLPYAKELICV